MGQQKSQKWLDARRARADAQWEAALEDALDRMEQVIVRERRDPTVYSLSRILTKRSRRQIYRYRHPASEQDHPRPAWTWEFLTGRLQERRPRAHAALLEIRNEDPTDFLSLTVRQLRFPVTAGPERRSDLEDYLSRSAELAAVYPRRMLDWSSETERGTDFCEAAIQLVRLLGRAGQPLDDRVDERKRWRHAATRGRRAMHAITPAFVLCDQLTYAWRQEAYEELATDRQSPLRYAILDDLGKHFDGYRHLRSITDDEWPADLDVDDVEEQGLPPEGLPVARRLVINDLPIPEDVAGHNRVTLDALTMFATRYYLLAAEVLYAKTRADGAATAFDFLAETKPSGQVAITDRLPLIGPLIGAVACGLLDRNPTANLNAAIKLIAGDDLKTPKLWRFPDVGDPSWDADAEQEAATRELRRVWIAATAHGLRHRQELQNLEQRLTQTQPPREAQPEPDESPTYRTALPVDYQVDPATVAAVVTVGQWGTGDGDDESTAAAFRRLQRFTQARFSAVTGENLEGVSYLDPIPPQAVTLVAAVLSRVNTPTPDILEWFAQLQQLYRHPLWQTLPLSTQQSWGKVVRDHGLDIAPRQWRQLLTDQRPYLRIPVHDAITELTTLLDNLSAAFTHGAVLPPEQQDLQPLITQLQQLHLQVLRSHDNVPATHPPDDWQTRAAVHWRHSLEPALPRAAADVTWRRDDPLNGTFTTRNPDRTVTAVLNPARAEVSLYLPLHAAADTSALSWKDWLQQLHRAERDYSIPKCGVAIGPGPTRPLALTTTVPLWPTQAGELLRVVRDLSTHPCADNPAPG